MFYFKVIFRLETPGENARPSACTHDNQSICVNSKSFKVKEDTWSRRLRLFSLFLFFFVRLIVLLISVFFSPSSAHAGSFINLAFGTNAKLFHAPVSRSALTRSSLKLSADLIQAETEGEMRKNRRKKKEKKKM